MEKTIEAFYKVLHRFHICKPKWEGSGDLTHVEFFILLGISNMLEEKGDFDAGKENFAIESKEITLGEIMKVTEMSVSAASKKISILEKKGLIERKISTKDRRNIYITLTEKGRELCVREKAKKREWMMEVINRMGIEDSQKMIELLNQMFDIMETVEKEK